jgi:hypothetical protein
MAVPTELDALSAKERTATGSALTPGIPETDIASSIGRLLLQWAGDNAVACSPRRVPAATNPVEVAMTAAEPLSAQLRLRKQDPRTGR